MIQCRADTRTHRGHPFAVLSTAGACLHRSKRLTRKDASSWGWGLGRLGKICKERYQGCEGPGRAAAARNSVA